MSDYCHDNYHPQLQPGNVMDFAQRIRDDFDVNLVVAARAVTEHTTPTLHVYDLGVGRKDNKTPVSIHSSIEARDIESIMEGILIGCKLMEHR